MGAILHVIKGVSVLSKSEQSEVITMIFDARGNGDGKVCCSIVGGHQTSISDYTAIVLEIHEREENTDRKEIL